MPGPTPEQKDYFAKRHQRHARIVDALCTPLNNGGRTIGEVCHDLAGQYTRPEIANHMRDMAASREIFAVNEDAPEEARRWRMLQ
jgi:hypothetical protein